MGRRWKFAAVMSAVIGAAMGTGRAGRVCDLAFSECPGRFSNGIAGIVKVPDELIWLDAKIPFCNEYIQIDNGTAKPPSVIFIIDNSHRFSDGRSGIDTLKALLKHDENGNLTYVTKLPASRDNFVMGRSNTRDGTDISLGFQAAKVAMKDS